MEVPRSILKTSVLIFSFIFQLRLSLSFWVGLTIFLIVHFGTLLPNAPGSVGVYQFFCVIGLTLFEVEKTSATGFSPVAFFFLKAPLWIIGSLVVTLSKIPLSSMQEKIGKLREGD